MIIALLFVLFCVSCGVTIALANEWMKAGRFPLMRHEEWRFGPRPEWKAKRSGIDYW